MQEQLFTKTSSDWDALMANTQLASEFGTDEIQNIVVMYRMWNRSKTVGIEAAQKD